MIYLTHRVVLNEFLGFGKKAIPSVANPRAIQNTKQALKVRQLEDTYHKGLYAQQKKVEAQLKAFKADKTRALGVSNITPADRQRIEMEYGKKMNAATNSIRKYDADFKRKIEAAKMNIGERVMSSVKRTGRIMRVKAKLAVRGARRFMRR